MDPCSSVRASSARVVAASRHVRIDGDRLEHFAETLEAKLSGKLPAWDDSGWHYADDVGPGGGAGPLTALYVLLLDTLNWCFWPSATGMEYDALASALTAVMRRDAAALAPAQLACVDTAVLVSWFAPHDVPAASERAAKVRELGEVLVAEHGGDVLNLCRRAQGSAVALVRLLAAALPGFRDEAVYDGSQVFFYKRAQIAVADLWAAHGRRTSGDGVFAFPDIAALTCFADYRIPQLLRAEGVLVYDAQLASDVDAVRELSAGGAYECEIRAATVVAVDALRDVLNARRSARLDRTALGDEADGDANSGRQLFTSVEVDWLLWQVGEASRESLPPHHRVKTVFY